jgi:hypothetical protein
VYAVFALYSPVYPLSPLLPPHTHTGTNLLLVRTCCNLLFSDFVEGKRKIEKKDFCFFEIHLATQGVSL